MNKKPLQVMLVAVLMLLSACSSSGGEGEESAGEQDRGETTDGERKVLRYADGSADLGTLDPHFASATADRNLADMVFNGLLRYSPGDGSSFEPDLAEAIPEPEIVDGKQVWEFTLREGVMCHPTSQTEAYELTSSDVVFSLEKAAVADSSAFAGEYEGMTISADGDYSVSIALDTPISAELFLPKVADYAGGFIMCQKAYEAFGPEISALNPSGTGPFMFDRYTAQDSVQLVANDDYFRGAPKLAGVDYRFIAEASSRELGLLSGDLDVIDGEADKLWVDRINGEDDVEVETYGVGQVTVIHLNTSVEELKDPRVREAIFLAVEREDFTGLFGDIAVPVFSQVPDDFLSGGLTQDEVESAGLDYARDLDRAKELMSEAGVEDLTLSVVSSDNPLYLKTYESMQAQLAQIGVTLEIEVVEHGTMHDLIRENANPIVVYIAWRPNADVFLTRFYDSASIVVTGESPDTNFSHYAEIDDLIVEARGEQDTAAQEKLWQEAQTKILEDKIALPLMYLNEVTARTANVDYGHELKYSLALYPQITEATTLT